MRKLLKGILVVAGALLALAALGVVAVNLYVQSVGTQKRIEQALSSGLKTPVHLTGTVVTPWSGLTASGITVPQVAPLTGNFLDAASFTARFNWPALFKRRLDASQVSLNEPRVIWFQSAGGRWELPRETAPAAAPQGSPGPHAEKERTGPAGPAWEISVHRLMVNDALFDFWGEKGNRVIEFAGVRFDCADPRASGAKGHAVSRSVSLHDRLFFRDMQTDWSFQRGTLKLSSLQAVLGGGQFAGDAQVATQTKHSPFYVDVKFDGVNANQLMNEGGQPAGEISGGLKGWVDLYGNSGKESTINGSGHIALAGGRLQNMEILEFLGPVLQLPPVLEFKTAEADARVVNGVVNVDRLVLDAQNLQLAAHGKIEAGGRIALDVRLTIGAAISSRLPSFVLACFKPGDAPDARYIDFQLGNTLSHPRNNLQEKILGRRIDGQMGDLLRSLFGNKHPKENNEPAPAGTP